MRTRRRRPNRKGCTSQHAPNFRNRMRYSRPATRNFSCGPAPVASAHTRSSIRRRQRYRLSTLRAYWVARGRLFHHADAWLAKFYQDGRARGKCCSATRWQQAHKPVILPRIPPDRVQIERPCSLIIQVKYGTFNATDRYSAIAGLNCRGTQQSRELKRKVKP